MEFLPVYKGVFNLLITVGVAVSTALNPALPTPGQVLQDPGVTQAVQPDEASQDAVMIGPIQPQIVEEPKSTSLDLMVVTEPVIEEEQKKVEVKTETKEIVIQSPSPVASVSPTSSTSVPAVTSSDVTLSGGAEKLFEMVNEYRKNKGLAAFEKEEKICKIADQRAPQVNDELSTGALHKGFKELNLPYWATENIAAYSSIEQNLAFWLSDYIHKKAIEGDFKYSCVACSGSSCSQIFTNFVQK